MDISLNLNFKSLEELAAVTKLLATAGININAASADKTSSVADTQSERRHSGRPHKEHVVQPLLPLQMQQHEPVTSSAAIRTVTSSAKRRSGKRTRRYNYKKYQMFVKLDGAIQAAAKPGMCVYATRAATDPTGTILYFAVPQPTNVDELLNIRSSLRKDYTEFYNKHIGEVTQQLQPHITSKCVYGLKRVSHSSTKK